MMFEPENYQFIFEDCIYSLVVGFILSFINEFLKSIFYKTKYMIFIKDVLLCLLFAVILFSYVVSFANYTVLRWYHILFSFIGFLVSRFSFSKILRLIFNLYFASFSVFLKHFREKFTIKLKIRTKKDIKNCESDEKTLKTPEVLLYNE